MALDTRQSGYGKYNGGCIAGQGRGVCVKTSDIPKNTELLGAMCGLWDSISDQWCRNDFGNDFNMIKKSGKGCAWGQGRTSCKSVPSGTKWNNIKCGAWDWVSASWCTDDYGPNWKSLGIGGNGCPWGS